MRTLAVSVLIVMCAAFLTRAPGRSSQATPAVANEQSCAPLGAAYTRTTLYFGLNRKTGSVSESQWRTFLRDEVTTRFPQGLTVWEADGQWQRPDGRIGHERAKVLLLVHEQTPAVRAALAAIVESYKRSFEQESVLWETAQVCAAF